MITRNNPKTNITVHDEITLLRQHIARLERMLHEQQQQTDALQQQVDMFAQALDLLPEMVLIKGDKSRIVYANQAFRTLYGMTQEQIQNIIDAPFNEPDYTMEYIKDDTYVFTTGETLVIPQEPVTRHDGVVRMLHTVKAPLRNRAGEVVNTVGISHDITEQYQLQAQHEQFFNLSVDMLCVAAMDGYFKRLNPAWERTLGFTHDELYAEPFLHFVHPDDHEMTVGIMQGLLKGEKVAAFENRYRCKDGTYVWLEWTFTPLDEHGMVYAVARNVTERKRVEDELRMFQTLAEMAPDSVAVATLDGVIIYANPAHRAAIGYGADETRLVLTDEYAEEPQYVMSLVERCLHQDTWQGVLTYRRRDGSTFPGQVSAMTIRDSQGHIQGVAGIIRDITASKQAEAERAALQQQIIEAQRAAIHELSTPLIPIADKVVVMPLVGTIDTARAQQMMEMLLAGVAEHQAQTVILDITGVQVVDSQVANTFIQAAQAVRLLGAQVMLTGIQPQMAQALVQLGVDLRGIMTRSTLQAGIRSALEQASSARR